MRLYLINPSNPLVSIVNVKESRWNRYRVWKPLSLMVLAGLTPTEWEISIVDENLGAPHYPAMLRPDLVGITAFTSQANRAYEVAAHFRRLGVPVVMGGIHATMCVEEAMGRVDSVVTGEAEGIWYLVLEDVRHGGLKRRYDGGLADISHVPIARHDLLATGYACGAIQTTRGCPLNCSFCSVTAFNGARYRQRSIADVVREFRLIPEKHVLLVDDNLIGTRHDHIARAKDLFRAMARANLGKQWVAQTGINFADDEELLGLAAKAGCMGVFIGFETPSPKGLRELGKKFNLLKGGDLQTSVRRIQRHGILVAGSFIIGLDVDEPGIGKRIAEAASRYGVDHLNALVLTPLPGTRLWGQMKGEPPSYGHAAKILDFALKVYVYYCKMPSAAKAETLVSRLNGAIDTPILRHLFKKLEGNYGESFPTHYLWTIKMIDKKDYDLLQKVSNSSINRGRRVFLQATVGRASYSQDLSMGETAARPQGVFS